MSIVDARHVGGGHRRAEVARIFPNDAAVIRLAGAAPLEQNDEWARHRRYTPPELLAPCAHAAPSLSLRAVAN